MVRKRFHSATLCLLVSWLILTAIGCGYGEISPMTYEYAKALYSISNRQAAERLDDVSRQIDSARQQGELSPQEAGWLQDIIDDARHNRWTKATQKSRQMMEDQVQKQKVASR